MKTDSETLLTEIEEDFCNYLNRGMDITSFSGKVDPNLNIDNLTRLLEIHFLMTEAVHEFVEHLPERLRRVKTSTARHQQVLHGEVRGRINWSDTIKNRYSENPGNAAVFVCDQRQQNYDIAENLVLKRLLSILYRIVDENIRLLEEDEMQWLEPWFEEDLLGILRQSWLRNIHVRNIELSEDTQVTERMIATALDSRQMLYREAAQLLLKYRDITNFDMDPSQARELLQDTFLQHQEDEVLFELYWLVRVVQGIQEWKDLTGFNFRVVEPGKNVVAEWETPESYFRIFHDDTGSLTFSEQYEDEIKRIEEQFGSDTLFDGFLFRTGKVYEELEEMIDAGTSSLWGGRPDILIERYQGSEPEGRPDQVFLGEVKYTNNLGYAQQGLRELLEYMAFIRDEERYYSKREEVLDDTRISGALFTDDVEIECQERSDVKVVRYGSERASGDLSWVVLNKGQEQKISDRS